MHGEADRAIIRVQFRRTIQIKMHTHFLSGCAVSILAQGTEQPGQG